MSFAQNLTIGSNCIHTRMQSFLYILYLLTDFYICWITISEKESGVHHEKPVDQDGPESDNGFFDLLPVSNTEIQLVALIAE